MVGSILAIVVGILVLFFTSHVLFTILGWALIVAGIVYAVRDYRTRNRTDL